MRRRWHIRRLNDGTFKVRLMKFDFARSMMREAFASVGSGRLWY